MSRIGRKPIAVPAGVDVKIDGSTVTVKGPKGTLTQTFRPEIGIKFENSEILVTRPNDEKMEKSLQRESSISTRIKYRRRKNRL